MKRIATVLLAGIAVLALSAESFAGANANAKIQLHIGPQVGKNICATGRKACNTIVTHVDQLSAPYPTGPFYFTYLLVTDGNAGVGVAGVQCGITYSPVSGSGDGVGFDATFVLCAALQFPSGGWPGHGGGNLITWDSSSIDPIVGCQKIEPGGAGTGVVAVAGYFYTGAYGPACISLGVRPVDNAAKVADCNAVEDIITGTPSHFGQACFGTASGPGYNPCGLITPVENTTWSKIKSNLR